MYQIVQNICDIQMLLVINGTAAFSLNMSLATFA